MTLSVTKREFMAAAVGGAAASVLPFAGAFAQQYPAQDIHMIGAFPPGSGSDVIVRYFAERLRPLLGGRAIIVETKVGAGGTLSMTYTSMQKPDGYTIYLHAGSAVAAAMSLFKKPPFPDAAKAIQIAATINRQPFMLAVDVKSPYKSVADVTEAMKKKGKNASYATAAPTGTVMGELYKAATGVEAVEVVYKNAIDSLNDQQSGALDYAMVDPVYAAAQQREGRLRILAVSTGQRLAANPDWPTMTEQGIPMDLTGWFAAMVPQGTPRPVVEQINKWFAEILAMPETKTFLNLAGGDPWISSVDDGQARLLRDIEAWKDYVRIAKIEPQG